MLSAAGAVAVPEVDYASLRADVVKAYAICSAGSRDDAVAERLASAQHRHSSGANSVGECLCLAA